VSGALEVGANFAGYRVLGVLGRGGMSVVYRAEDLRLGRQVALKVLSSGLNGDPAFRERFEHESRILASIEHPDIVDVFHADEVEGVAFLAMRLIEGSDLGALLRDSGRLEPAAVAHITGKVAGALDKAHAHGLVHRDVKPGNILIAGQAGSLERARVYLTDFGLTKRRDAQTQLTSTGQFLGTVDYVAPEQIQGTDIDGRADLYALACVAFHCLAGRPPFHESMEAAALMAHLVSRPPKLRDVRADLPEAASLVLARGMAKNRDQRPATCAEFAAQLRAALLGGVVGAAEQVSGLPEGQRQTSSAAGSAQAPWPELRAAAGPTGVAAHKPAIEATTAAYFDHPGTFAPPLPARPHNRARTSSGRRREGAPLARRLAMGAIALALLAAGGMVAVDMVGGLVNSPTAGATPSRGTPLDRGSAEEILRSEVAAAVRPSCRADSAVATALAVLTCSAEGGSVGLRYSLYADEAELSAAYLQIRDAHGIEADSGARGSRCADPAAWPNEGVWTYRSEPSGRLLCGIIGGRPRMIWTDVRSNVLTAAVEHAGDGRRLYRFWRDGRFPAMTSPSPVPAPTALAPPTGAGQLRNGHLLAGLRPADLGGK
jgi:predicted Ser/Thr protein kinase